ncbi:hypothetical protein Bbelb_313940 [Branchiostoma belcheri]|nr:hypothetical protein Bbelb_313940 [Branchiostoma belcheri]
MKERECTDAIFALRQLNKKAVEYNRELNLVFVNQEKAFDRVNREKLWAALDQYNVSGQLFVNIRALYKNCKCVVRPESKKQNSVSYQLAPLLKHPSIPMETKAKVFNLSANPYVWVPDLELIYIYFIQG